MSQHFRITLQPSSHVLEVRAGESVLAAANRLGYNAPHACQQAVCGICRGRVLSGTLIYEDDVKPYGLFEQEIADGYVLLCQAIPTSDATVEWHDVRAPGEFAVSRIGCPVQSVTPLTDDTWRVLLQVPAHARAEFHAGQYLQLRMPDGSARAFSIASAPENIDQIELHIRAVAEHASAREVVNHLQTRRMVTVELPFGSSKLPTNDKPLLLLAGGTGFAPMKALIESSIARAETRPLYLYWGAQTETALYWHQQLQTLAAQHPRLHYTPVLSHPDASWNGATGFPHLIAAAEHHDLSQFEVFASGSEAMARAIYQNYLLRGLPEVQFHCDWIDLLRSQGAL